MGLTTSYKNKLDELKKGVRSLELQINRGKARNREHVAKGFRTLGARYEMLNSNTVLRPSRNAYAALESKRADLANPRQGLFGHTLTRTNHVNLKIAQSGIARIQAKILGWEGARRHWQDTRQSRINGPPHP